MLDQPSSIPGIGPRALILVPTRELAMQVAAAAEKYSQHLKHMRTVCIYGGSPYPKQIRDLSRPHEILVATPGRLIDHIERGRIKLSRVEMLILDEADRMLDMGFIEPVEQIAALTPKQRQTLLFSATLKGPVIKLSERLLHNPLEISVIADKAKHENIEQHLYTTDGMDHKLRILSHILNDPNIKQAIVFTATKRGADQLADKLNGSALHGDMNQRQRTRTISQMRNGQIRVLVATDVAARGIDVQSISHVINFDLSHSVEDHVHRIGRTGRAGASGIAISFAAHKDMPFVRQIEQFTNQKMLHQVVAGMEPRTKSSPKPQPPGRPKRKFKVWAKRR